MRMHRAGPGGLGRIFAAITAVLLLGLGGPSMRGWADVGPRPPVTPTQVPNTQSFMTMKSEEVNVQVNGQKASVIATFHFETVQKLWRSQNIVNLGFPELRKDKPLKNFIVRQRAYNQYTEADAQYAPVGDVQKSASMDPTGGQKAGWYTWTAELDGSNGTPVTGKLDIQVSYDQALTPVAGSKASRFTYVLTSGAPWAGPIGSAKISVKVVNAAIAASTPAGSVRTGNNLVWRMKNFEPVNNITVTVTPGKTR